MYSLHNKERCCRFVCYRQLQTFLQQNGTWHIKQQLYWMLDSCREKFILPWLLTALNRHTDWEMGTGISGRTFPGKFCVALPWIFHPIHQTAQAQTLRKTTTIFSIQSLKYSWFKSAVSAQDLEAEGCHHNKGILVWVTLSPSCTETGTNAWNYLFRTRRLGFILCINHYFMKNKRSNTRNRVLACNIFLQLPQGYATSFLVAGTMSLGRCAISDSLRQRSQSSPRTPTSQPQPSTYSLQPACAGL